jgi:hypothetical protein
LADTRAIGETGGADAFAGSADHATGAFSAAGSAVIGVAGGIYTGARTSGLSIGAVENALAVGAELTGCAFSTADTAVVEVIGQVLADTGAIGETGGADAFARSTDHAAGAFSAAGSAVIGITFGIDTGARASGLSIGAIENALAVGAELTGCALSTADTAVVEVIGQVLADTGAIGETGGADAFAGSADHAAGAFSAAGSAVIGVTGGINARARASGLAGGTVEYACAVGAELTGGTFIGTSATVFEVDFEVAADT